MTMTHVTDIMDCNGAWQTRWTKPVCCGRVPGPGSVLGPEPGVIHLLALGGGLGGGRDCLSAFAVEASCCLCGKHVSCHSSSQGAFLTIIGQAQRRGMSDCVFICVCVCLSDLCRPVRRAQGSVERPHDPDFKSHDVISPGCVCGRG